MKKTKKLFRIFVLLIGLILFMNFLGMIFSIGSTEFDLREFLIVFLKMFAAFAWFFATKESSVIPNEN
ncbi:hypothetical protein [Clostridium chrysemydis]|uniref:hypothetical protein n=1 Tax=Clostridium chrysemydis TaxID=2665504 RepID=UPI0018840116|nr:hypothetical protein [Clostridium chrysemydis]